MKILIDIGHPANVHYFRHFAGKMQEGGHQIFFTTHNKEFEPELLTAFGFKYKILDKHRKGVINKILGVLIKTVRLWIYSRKIKPDLFLSSGSFAAAYTSFLLMKPHITLEDTGNYEQIWPIKPFTAVFLTPDVLQVSLGKKQIRINSFFELAALHPNYFKPDLSVLRHLGINENEPYCILRFVAWEATHDIQKVGLSYDLKKKLVEALSKKFRVYISSEKTLPADFNHFKLSIPPEMMHDALALSSLYVGEGGTTATECAVLGVPNILINPLAKKIGNHIQLQSKYGLQFYFDSIEDAFPKIEEILSDKDIKDHWLKRREKLLEDKIDLTAFLIWFVEHYPKSRKEIQESPLSMNKFKSQ